MHLGQRFGRTLALISAVSVAPPTLLHAEDWPSRPVTMVIPFAAGSGVDILGRILAPRLSEILGQPVIVENVGGAGGMVGAARVARAAPDGNVFVLGNIGTHAYNQTLYRKPLYDAAADFAPVILIAEQPIVLIARRDLPGGNFSEFQAFAKANVGKLKFGSAGPGSAAHLACALLNAEAGISATHIPYRGGAPAMQDLIGGRIDYQCPLAALAIPQIKSGQVKALAVLAQTRLSALPELPSIGEQGLTNFDATTWNAVLLPAGTPVAIVIKLHDAVSAAMDTPALAQRLSEIGFGLVAPPRRSPDYLRRFVRAEIDKWAPAIRAAGISGE